MEVRHNLASLHADVRGQRARAIGEWQAILNDKPDYLPARVSLALALEREQRFVEAIAQYDEIILQEPEYVAAFLAISDLHLRLGRTSAAIERLQTALALQPHNPIIYEKLGAAHLAANNLDAPALPTKKRSGFLKMATPDAASANRLKSSHLEDDRNDDLAALTETGRTGAAR